MCGAAQYHGYNIVRYMLMCCPAVICWNHTMLRLCFPMGLWPCPPLLAGGRDCGGGGGGSPAVHLVNGDLLQDDVSDAGVVLVADQCWDAELRAAAVAKLRRELPAGAVVVSYTGAVVEDQEQAGAGAGEGAFEELAVVRVPVSWNDEQVMRVLRKRV